MMRFFTTIQQRFKKNVSKKKIWSKSTTIKGERWGGGYPINIGNRFLFTPSRFQWIERSADKINTKRLDCEQQQRNSSFAVAQPLSIEFIKKKKRLFKCAWRVKKGLAMMGVVRHNTKMGFFFSSPTFLTLLLSFRKKKKNKKQKAKIHKKKRWDIFGEKSLSTKC